MTIDQVKSWIDQNVPPKARRLVVAYAMQSAVLDQIRQEAINAGAPTMVLDMAKSAIPMFAGQLFGSQEQT